MAYRIIVDPAAGAAIHALPAEARPALAEAMDVLGIVPWNGDPINEDNPDAEVRTLPFGPTTAGMLTYLIVEHDREVHVLLVQWAG
ncbi:MAG: hypothetical protein ACRDTE_17910 [Pseudonocardiaceae bacterium]